jgi:hypothetical protein
MFLREQEIRAAFRGADAGMRTGEYLRAAEAGDIETTRAFQDAPGAPWVSAEIKARAEEAYALRTNPDGLRRLKGIEFLREHLSSLAEQTAQWLVRLGAKPETVAKAVKEAA